MAFVKFTAGERGTMPQAFLSPSGIISFNQAAIEKFGLKDWIYTALYLDPDRHTVAFEHLPDMSQDGAHRIRRIRCQALDIDARAFLQHFKLRVKKALSFRLRQDPDNGWLFIRLDEGAVVDVTSAGPAPAAVSRREDVGTRTVDRPAHDIDPAEEAAASALLNAKRDTMTARAPGTPANNGSDRGAASRPAVPARPDPSRPRGGVRGMIAELLQD